MTVLGSIKRIARRPSLLLKGPKTAGPVETDSSDENSFASEESSQEKCNKSKTQPSAARTPARGVKPSRSFQNESQTPVRGVKPSKAFQGDKGTPIVQTPGLQASLSCQDTKGDIALGISRGLEAPWQPIRRSRRASTGGGFGKECLSVSCHAQINISVEQRQRIERLKNRRRLSATHVNSSLNTNNSAHSSEAEEDVNKMSPTRARRHSLSYEPNSQEPKPLYTVRPDPKAVTKPPEPTERPMKKGLSFVRRNSLTASKEKGTSMRSIGSGSVQTNGTHRSANSQHSNGSTFSSTGWSVAPGGESPRRSSRRSTRLDIGSVSCRAVSRNSGNGLGRNSGHGLRRGLYTSTYDSNRSLDSINDSVASDW